MFAEIMTFNEKHDEGVKLFMTVDYTNQIARIALSKYLAGVSGSSEVDCEDLLRVHTSEQVEASHEAALERPIQTRKA
jgi:hypothetical protein